MNQYKVIRTLEFKEIVYVEANSADDAILLASCEDGEIESHPEVVDMTAVLIIN